MWLILSFPSLLIAVTRRPAPSCPCSLCVHTDTRVCAHTSACTSAPNPPTTTARRAAWCLARVRRANKLEGLWGDAHRSQAAMGVPRLRRVTLAIPTCVLASVSSGAEEPNVSPSPASGSLVQVLSEASRVSPLPVNTS